MTVETGFDPGIEAMLAKNTKTMAERKEEQDRNREIAGKENNQQNNQQSAEGTKEEGANQQSAAASEEAAKAEGTKEEGAGENREEAAAPADNEWLFGKKSDKAAANSQQGTDTNATGELAELLKDPEFKAVYEAKKAGKSVFELVNEVQGEDPKRMPVESLIAWAGKKEGLHDEAIATEVSNFEKLKEDSPLQAKKFENQLRTERADEQRAALLKVTGEASQTSREAQQKQDVIMNKLNAEVAAASSEMIGKGFFGITLTENDAKDFEKYIKTEFNLFRADGTYDVNKLRLFYMAEHQLSRIAELNAENGKHAGIKEALKDVSRVNLNTGVAGKVPTPVPPTDPKDVSKGAHELIKTAYSPAGVGGK